MTIALITATGTAHNLDGTLMAGNLHIEPTATMTSPGSYLVPQVDTKIILENGSIPAGTQLYATDDPSVDPQGVQYRLIFRPDHGDTFIRYVNVPYNAPGGTYDIISNSTTDEPDPTVTAWASQSFVAANFAAIEDPITFSLIFGG